ncbi:hypothetical protein [Planctomycetes bacterium Pan216]|uniref:hypothetical protein n=1 Tax=Kolteria novifilia TaxID=2527975 RepID=UPI0011A1B441
MKSKSKMTDDDVDGQRESVSGDAAKTNDSPVVNVSLWDGFVEVFPLALLVIGILLSVFTTQIGPWAFLGYLFIALSPILHALQRIERRLIEIRDQARLKKSKDA